MNLRDSLRLTLRHLRQRGLRSWLTILGIVIGVAAVVSIVSIGEG
ncbi:MAG: ABC transporter permease, partial [Euryarchaeota archaeon]|nr:ABC transporter permease [Euryarchaeota archaeon]